MSKNSEWWHCPVRLRLFFFFIPLSAHGKLSMFVQKQGLRNDQHVTINMYADHCVNYTWGKYYFSNDYYEFDFVFSCNSSSGGENEQDTEEIDEEIGQQWHARRACCGRCQAWQHHQGKKAEKAPCKGLGRHFIQQISCDTLAGPHNIDSLLIISWPRRLLFF